MKKLVLIFCILLISCEKAPTENYYPMDKILEPSNKLYTRNSQIRYPNEVTSPSDGPYKKEELYNLDYNKEVFLADIYFRIPERAKVFEKDSEYFIDFPLSSDYSLTISFKEISKPAEEKMEEILKEKSYKGDLVSRPVNNDLSTIKSSYFISKDKDTTYTHFFMGDYLYFIITEEGSKASSAIMADMLMTAYRPADDPKEVKKNFEKYDLSIYATKDVGGIKIPENFVLNQEEEGFRSFVARGENKEVIGEIIIKEDELDEAKEAFDLNTGPVIYPAFIINMGKVDNNESDIRLYLTDNTFSGRKFVIEGDKTTTVIVAGPLKNKSLVTSMAENIKNSIVSQ